MPITSCHPLYEKHLPTWRKCRVFATSGDAVKEQGDDYLPNVFQSGALQSAGLEGVSNLNIYQTAGLQYDAYKMRALVYEATARTVGGLVGAAMRKPPDCSKLPKPLESFRDDMLGLGNGVDAAASQILTELLITARVGLFVDRADNPGMSAETDQPLLLSLYQSEQIINWYSDSRSGELKWVVLREDDFEPSDDDPYESEEVTRYRELMFDENGRYIQRIWTKIKTDKGEEWMPEPIQPTRRQNPLTSLPFVLLTPLGESARIISPPILPLVNVNADHYRMDADHKHGLHFCGLPTPYGKAIDAQRELPGGRLVLGSSVAYVFESQYAELDYLTLNSAELSALADEKKNDLELMALLGARLLGSTPKVAETATAATIHAAGETNALVNSVDATGRGLERAFEIARDWQYLNGDCPVAMNKDFVNVEMSPQMLTALVATLQAGGMSMSTFLYNLRQGELRHPDLTDEQELALIEDDQGRLNLAGDSEFMMIVDTIKARMDAIEQALGLSKDDDEAEVA